MLGIFLGCGLINNAIIACIVYVFALLVFSLFFMNEACQYVLLELASKGIIKLSDKAYLSMLYRKMFNKKLDLKDPKTFNEKLQWLKLYDRQEKYTEMVDKCEAKKYVANLVRRRIYYSYSRSMG